MGTTVSTALSTTGARLLALLGLPQLPALPQLDPATRRTYEEFTNLYVDRSGSKERSRPPEHVATYLRWLAENRPHHIPFLAQANVISEPAGRSCPHTKHSKTAHLR